MRLLLKPFIILALLISSPAIAADKMTVLLDWFVNPDHGPLIIAQEKGYFADAGLEVEIVAPADPSAPPKLVAAGQADIASPLQDSRNIGRARQAQHDSSPRRRDQGSCQHSNYCQQDQQDTGL